MAAPKGIVDRIETFGRNRDQYHGPGYKEAQLRQEFIDPMLEELGWDVSNKNAWAEPYKEVVHEDAIKVAGSPGTKAPDYSLRVGGVRKLFVEAKRPSVKIESDAASAYQLRRYAWTANLPISILTNFEKLAIYDCRIMPNATDKASVARIALLEFTDYASNWDQLLAGVLSKEAVLRGYLDKFIAEAGKKRGTAEVDAEFLSEIERWRKLLASDIAKNNEVTDEQINFAVQRTIDRILFLRMCEDRGIEPYGQLRDLLERDDIYKKLVQLYRRADAKYNSGLFQFSAEKDRDESPDTLTLRLRIEDRPLHSIIKHLYYPDCRYEFAYLPTEILGQVYEQFLGKTIRLSATGATQVVEKPEVRRAGGVYYTPSFVVDYIVRAVLGPLVHGKTPKAVANLRVLDPACGSGSFLIGVYQFLLDWHLREYYKNPKDHRNEIYEGPGGMYRLSTRERKRILTNSVFGVDIDSQAVEVTKLSLLLKVLEGESKDTLASQLKLFDERALPDLGHNIKCGNSLIEHDIADADVGKFSDAEMVRINPFDWEQEFPAIMSKGGFHAVVGNPPYDVLEKERGQASWPHDALARYGRAHPLYAPALGGKLNLFRFFVVRSQDLLREGGRFGMIMPMAILADISCASSRLSLILNSTDMLADCFPQKDSPKRRIFKDAKLSTAIVTCSKKSGVPMSKASVKVRVFPANSFNDPHRVASIRLEDVRTLDPGNFPIPLANQDEWSLCTKIHRAPKVVRLADMSAYAVTRGEINQKIYEDYIEDAPRPGYVRMVKGVEIAQYYCRSHLSQGQFEWLNEQRFLKKHGKRPIVEQRRIATQRITGMDEHLRVVATVIEPRAYFADSTNSIGLVQADEYSLEYLLAFLNSSLYQWRFKVTSTNNNVGTNELESMPIRTIDRHDPKDVELRDAIVKAVEELLAVNADLQKQRVPAATKQRLEKKAAYLISRIDDFVYQAFSLNADDILSLQRFTRRPEAEGAADDGDDLLAQPEDVEN